MCSAIATITSGSSYPEGEVVLPRKRGEPLQLINSYIHILWLLLHFFSRCDYNKWIKLPGRWSCSSTKERWAFTIDKQLYIDIMIIIACFQPLRLLTSGSSYPEGEVVLPRKRGEPLQLINSYTCIYILWLLLHVFSRGDKNKWIQLPGRWSCSSTKERWAFTIDKQLYTYIMIIIACFQPLRL